MVTAAKRFLDPQNAGEFLDKEDMDLIKRYNDTSSLTSGRNHCLSGLSLDGTEPGAEQPVLATPKRQVSKMMWCVTVIMHWMQSSVKRRKSSASSASKGSAQKSSNKRKPRRRRLADIEEDSTDDDADDEDYK